MISKLYILIVVVTVHASAGQITRVDPPNWWTDMNYDTLSLMLYGSDFTGLLNREIIFFRLKPAA